MTVLVRIVDALIATDSAGKTVDATIVRETEDGEVSGVTGYPVDPVAMEIDEDVGFPVYVVDDWTAVNAAGVLVDVAPVKGVGSARIVLSANSQAENTTIGTTIGNLSVVGGTGTWTFTKTADPSSAFTLTGAALKNAIVFNWESATSYSVTIQATNGTDTISATLTVYVTNVLEVTLGALTLSDTSAVPGEAWSATITGKTSGSTITATSSDGTVLTVVGTTVSGTFAAEGTPNVTLHETHPDANARDSVVAVTVAAVSGSAPGAYTVGQWTLADNAAGNSLTITILTVPSLNGNTQTGTQYRINGGAWQDTALVGLGDIVIVDGTDLPNDDPADIEIRVLVAEYDWDVDGSGDEDGISDTKNATPTLVTAAAPDAFAEPGWDLVPLDGGLGVDFDDLPYNGGSTITDIKYRVDSGAWTISGGIVPFTIPGLTNGVEYDVELQTINPIGASGPSDLKSETPEAAVTGLTAEFAGWLNNPSGGHVASGTLNLGTAPGYVLIGAMSDGDPFTDVWDSLPLLASGDSWGPRNWYGAYKSSLSGSTAMTVTATSGDPSLRCGVWVIRGSSASMIDMKDYAIGGLARVTVEAGDLVFALRLTDNDLGWADSPTEPANTPTYADGLPDFWKGWGADFTPTAPAVDFHTGSPATAFTTVIVLGEPA